MNPVDSVTWNGNGAWSLPSIVRNDLFQVFCPCVYQAVCGEKESDLPEQVFRYGKGFSECAQDSQWFENFDATRARGLKPSCFRFRTVKEHRGRIMEKWTSNGLTLSSDRFRRRII
jgi:hypothetical protein